MAPNSPFQAQPWPHIAPMLKEPSPLTYEIATVAPAPRNAPNFMEFLVDTRWKQTSARDIVQDVAVGIAKTGRHHTPSASDREEASGGVSRKHQIDRSPLDRQRCFSLWACRDCLS